MPLDLERKYNDEQRDAVGRAFEGGIRPAGRVVELAAAGELPGADGEPLEPFAVPESSVRALARRWRRQGRAKTRELADLEPRDAVEALRLGLLDVAERELRALRRQKAGDVDVARLNRLARTVRELQAVPGPNDDRRPAPGQKVNGERNGGETRTGLAGDILRAHREGAVPVAPPPAEAPPPPPELEPEQLDPLDVAREQTAERIRARFPHLADDPPTPEPTPTARTWQSVVHPADEVPPGTRRDQVRYDRLPDEDTSAGLGRW